MASARGPAFLSAFSFPNYRRLWAGAFVSSVGTWIQDVALAWLIHTRLGNPAYLGYRAFAAEVPLIAFMVVGGAVADRADRRRILLASQVLQMGYAAALGILHALGRLTLGPILLIALLTGLTQSQSAPTYQATLSSLVPRAHIPSAVAMNSLQFNLSRTVGPAVAGLLLARGGTGLCFVANALSFLAVIVALLRLEVAPPAGPRPAESLGASLRAGFRHVRHHPLLARLTLLAATASFLAFPLITYLPVVASESLGAGAGGFSLLISCYGGGAILGALATAQRGPAAGRGRTLLAGFVAYSLAVTGAVYSGRLDLAMALLFVAGFSLVTAFSTVNSLVQENASDEFRGRVQGIYGLAFRGGSPFGSLIAGGLVGRLGAPLVLAGYSLVLALVALGAWRSRQVRAL